jgi:hypothetical protein
MGHEPAHFPENPHYFIRVGPRIKAARIDSVAAAADGAKVPAMAAVAVPKYLRSAKRSFGPCADTLSFRDLCRTIDVTHMTEP